MVLNLTILEKKVFKVLNVFLLFHYYHPLEKGLVLHLYKLEFPSPKDSLCQFLLKLTYDSEEEDINGVKY